jgi:hypothetical protein
MRTLAIVLEQVDVRRGAGSSEPSSVLGPDDMALDPQVGAASIWTSAPD